MENSQEAKKFETDRNLYHTRDFDFLIARALIEWAEFTDEMAQNDLERALAELLDFINFSMSIAMHIADKIGVAPEQLDTMMDRINRLRDASTE